MIEIDCDSFLIELIDLDLDQFPKTVYFRFVTQCKKQIDNSAH